MKINTLTENKVRTMIDERERIIWKDVNRKLQHLKERIRDLEDKSIMLKDLPVTNCPLKKEKNK